jgi:fatty acid desaturase
MAKRYQRGILNTPLVSFGHCVVCSSSLQGFWLTLWYLLAIVLSALLRYTDWRADNTMAKRYQRVNQNPCSEEEQATQWPKDTKGVIRIPISNKNWQHNGNIQILITALVSFGHCVVCSSSIYRFWLPLLYLLAIVSSALLRYTDSDYPFGIFQQILKE